MVGQDHDPNEQLGEAATRIVEDFENDRGPFAEPGITVRITDQIDGQRETALYLTFTTALNRQRDAERLYEKFERLWYDEHWIFEPDSLIEEHDYQESADLFVREGTRFGEQDAQVWYEIARTLYEEFDSDPMNLFAFCDNDMQQLEEYVRTASGDTRFFDHGKRFPALRGAKIRPLWLRLISNQVCELKRPGGSEVSVDTHIVQITNKICGTDLSGEPERHKIRIRQFWREVCEPVSIDPIEIDAALWYIDRAWDDWGESYLKQQLHEVGLELGDVEIKGEELPSIPNRVDYDSDEEWVNAVSTEIGADSLIIQEIINQATDSRS